jgi:hypothetical protein
MGGVTNVKRSDEPHSPLTQLVDDMLATLAGTTDVTGLRAVVMLTNAEDGGLGFAGYEDDEAQFAVDVLNHIEAYLKTLGLTLVAEIRKRPKAESVAL